MQLRLDIDDDAPDPIPREKPPTKHDRENLREFCERQISIPWFKEWLGHLGVAFEELSWKQIIEIADAAREELGWPAVTNKED